MAILVASRYIIIHLLTNLSHHRWGHVNVVQYLLSNKFMWPSKELKKAYEQASNKEVKSLIKAELDKDKKSFFKRLLSSPRKTPKTL